jgi:hypothetical protein
MAKKAPAPANAGPSGSNPPSETMGAKGSAYRAKGFGVSPGAPEHSNPNAARAEAMSLTLRDNSPGAVPEGTSAVIVSPSDAQEETPAPTARQDPRENKEV